MKLHLPVLAFLLALTLSSRAATCVSQGNGAWESAATWLCDGIPAIPAGGDNVIIQAGHTVTQTTNHTIAGAAVFVYVYGNWHFGNGSKISLPCGSGVQVMAGGSITASTGGASNRIEICSTVVWKSSDGDVTSPMVLGNNPPPPPLPVELISLKAERTPTGIEIQWVTASETANSHFLVERSANGKEFNTLGRVDGSGYSEIAHFYFFLDESPESGVNYYRLRQVDYDGAEEFSELISARWDKKGEEPTVFPNPAMGGMITFSWGGFINPGSMLSVMDYQGRLVYTTEADTTNYYFTLSASDMNLTPGTYFVLFTSGSDQRQVPLIINQ